jgi:small neutral amino acid transporter SnatA (MarC family)
MAIVNIVYLVNLNNAKRAKRIAIMEVLAALVLFFVSWSFSKAILDNLSKWF